MDEDEDEDGEVAHLVDELVEGVLAVGARLAPHDRAGAVAHLRTWP